MKPIISAGLLSALLLGACSLKRQTIDHTAMMDYNHLKSLRGEVVMMPVFLDTKKTGKWTEEEMDSIMKNFKVAAKWIQARAAEDDVSLSIKVARVFRKKGPFKIADPPGSSLGQLTFNQSARCGPLLSRWAGKAACTFLPVVAGGKPSPKMTSENGLNVLIDWCAERENNSQIAVFYLLKADKKYGDVSVALNSNANGDKFREFVLLTFHDQQTIAHEFLHLFGARDLYQAQKFRNKKQVNFVAENYPNELMHVQTSGDLEGIELSPATRYLIGWTKEVPPADQRLLAEKVRIR